MGAAQHRIEVHRALVVLALEVPVRFETVPAGAGEADACFAAPAGMVISQAALVVDAMRARKLPAMFAEPERVAKGGLPWVGADQVIE